MWYKSHLSFLSAGFLLFAVLLVQGCDSVAVSEADTPTQVVPPSIGVPHPLMPLTASGTNRHPAAKTDGAEMVPFDNGKFDLDWDLFWIDWTPCSPNPDATSGRVHYIYVGEMQHLGETVLDMDNCIEFPGWVYVDTRVTFNGDNGDQVFAEFVSLPDPVPEGYDNYGVYEITGGTGRFENVVGWYESGFIYAPDFTWAKQKVYAGEIASVGSSK